MWKKVHSQICSDVKKEDLWQIWTDVNHWPDWHSDLEYCRLEGDFKVGNQFILKPKGAPAVKIELIEISPGTSFKDKTRFWGASMYDTHILEETPTGLRLTNILEVTGPLSWLWIKLVAGQVAKTVPADMQALVALARSKHG